MQDNVGTACRGHAAIRDTRIHWIVPDVDVQMDGLADTVKTWLLLLHVSMMALWATHGSSTSIQNKKCNQ